MRKQVYSVLTRIFPWGVPGLPLLRNRGPVSVMIVKQTFGLVSKGFNLQKPRATYTSQNGVFTERVR